jgi:peptide/nickel transport system permease protein
LSFKWILNRSLSGITVLFFALIINFIIPRLMPGNPVDMFSGGVKLTLESRAAIVERFGLDLPLHLQFKQYVLNSLKGDFGVSFFYYPQKVTKVIFEALPWTLLVILTSLFLQVIMGFFLGAESAWKAGSKADAVIQTVSIFIFSTPLFWVAMVFLYLFGYKTGWFPLGGAYTIGADYESIFEQVMDIARHAFLPIISLTIAQYASYQLILRNSMVAVLKEQYILTARAKGLDPRRIKYVHAARNALLPMFTFLGMSFALSMGGSVFVETVFSYPGIGKLIFDSVISRDYPLLQGCFFMFSLVVIVVNFFIDMVYQVLDPRITMG